MGTVHSVNLVNITPATAKAQNVEWFTDVTPDVQNDKSITLRLAVSTVESIIIEVTFNSGTTWVSLNNGDALVANAWLE